MKILFISHDASRTGAPILLLNLLKLLKENSAHELSVLLKNGGPLEDEFKHVAKTFTWNKPWQSERRKNIKDRFVGRLNSSFNEDQIRTKILQEARKADVIINNTITNGKLLALVTRDFKGTVVSYIHELEMSCARFATPEGIELTMRLSGKLATPSMAVSQYLCDKYKAGSQRLFPLYYYVPDTRVQVAEDGNINNKDRLRVAGCGGPVWRKGMDIFIAVIIYLKSINEDHHFEFLWKGGDPGTAEHNNCLYDVKKAGLKDMITFYPSDANMASFYNNIDVFVLSSREDPYPLVVLEAASFGKPAVCFSNAGGAPEFVQEDAGSVVPYLDITAVANALLNYHQNRNTVFEKGQKANARLKMLHQNKSLILEQFNQLIKN